MTWELTSGKQLGRKPEGTRRFYFESEPRKYLGVLTETMTKPEAGRTPVQPE